MRAILLALLASIVLDVADGDCLTAFPSGDVACPSPGADCACCVVSEPAGGGVEPQYFSAPRRAVAAAPGRLHDGVRPVPYRPPLQLT